MLRGPYATYEEAKKASIPLQEIYETVLVRAATNLDPDVDEESYIIVFGNSSDDFNEPFSAG